MKDLTEGNELKQIVFFSLPMLLGNILQQLYNVADSIVVGQNIGAHALAAVGMSFPVLFVFLSLSIGFSMASNILIAQFFGAKKHKSIELVIQTSFLLLFFAGLIITLLGIYFAPYILKIMRTPKDVLPEALTYLRIMFSGFTFIFMYNGITAMLRGLGDSLIPLYALAISAIMNIILDCIFVIWFNWGTAGAGYATLISQIFSCVWILFYSRAKYGYFKVNYFKLQFDKHLCIESVKIGLPTGIQQALVGGGFMAMSSVVNIFGTQAAAAFSAVGKLDGFIIMPGLNISAALSSFTGQNLGAGKKERVKKGLRGSLLLGLSITTIAVFLLAFFGSFFISLFVDKTEVVLIGAEYFKIASVSYLLLSVTFILTGVIRGAGKAMFPMISTLLAMWIFRVPSAGALSQYWGLNGIWFSFNIGAGAGLLLTVIYYFSGKWQK
ncbi:MATE family efflux transporter [Treponema pedis]|uniref:Multidrug-efflux transporter n=1 Tax=Treponema pedis TaxID=409322 RepID=A0A7S7AWS1_9SPIR|nr:MATE family efflux transporter [Treponema pedis]QOW61222.1 MATE family efflux transporter [Treponema pedis]QSI04468.1 MATE family efflux transporter [Treponema pedis]